MKKFIVVFAILALLPNTTNAVVGEAIDGTLNYVTNGVSDEYIPLEPLPYSDNVPEVRGGQSNFLERIYYITLSISVVLAIIMIIIAGATYTATGVSSEAKKSAKDRAMKAITGLGLAFGSWLLLNEINPNIASPKIVFNVPEIAVKRANFTDHGAGGAGNYDDAHRQEEESIRAQLEAAGISVNKNPCVRRYQVNCTDVYGLPDRAISGLVNLKAACENWARTQNIGSCPITITGGTEYGHATHGVGLAVVDLSFSTTLTKFLISEGSISNGRVLNPNSVTNCAVINYSGDSFRFEPAGSSSCSPNSSADHWHVQF